jgi:hypothetical protein
MGAAMARARETGVSRVAIAPQIAGVLLASVTPMV